MDQQQQQPIPPQQPYPAAQPMMMMMDKPQQIPVQYMTQPGVQFVPIQQQGMPLPLQTVPPPPTNLLPSHNLVVTIIVTIACTIFNLSSLMIGAPAMICAIVAYNSLTKQRYSTTKSLGYAAVVLSIVNVAYTGIITTVIVGMSIGLCGRQRYYGGYYSYYNGYNYYYDTNYSCT